MPQAIRARLDKIIAIDLNLNGEAFAERRLRNRILGAPFANRQGQLNVGSYGNDE